MQHGQLRVASCLLLIVQQQQGRHEAIAIAVTLLEYVLAYSADVDLAHDLLRFLGLTQAAAAVEHSFCTLRPLSRAEFCDGDSAYSGPFPADLVPVAASMVAARACAFARKLEWRKLHYWCASFSVDMPRWLASTAEPCVTDAEWPTALHTVRAELALLPYSAEADAHAETLLEAVVADTVIAARPAVHAIMCQRHAGSAREVLTSLLAAFVHARWFESALLAATLVGHPAAAALVLRRAPALLGAYRDRLRRQAATAVDAAIPMALAQRLIAVCDRIETDLASMYEDISML